MLLLLLQAVQCHNHIRAVFQVDDTAEYCVCGTGARSPQEQFLDVRTLIFTRLRCSRCPRTAGSV